MCKYNNYEKTQRVKQVRVQQTGERGKEESWTHLWQLLKISLHGLSSRFSLHWSAKTSAMSTRWGDYINTCKHTQWHIRTHTHTNTLLFITYTTQTREKHAELLTEHRTALQCIMYIWFEQRLHRYLWTFNRPLEKAFIQL